MTTLDTNVYCGCNHGTAGYNSMSTYDDTTLSQIYSVHSEVAAAAATNTSNVSTISEHTSTLPIISLNNSPTNLTANLKWDNTIQLVVSVDASDLLNGLVALLQSISQHSSKNTMTIHIVVNTRDREKVQRKIACSVRLPEATEVSVSCMTQKIIIIIFIDQIFLFRCS